MDAAPGLLLLLVGSNGEQQAHGTAPESCRCGNEQQQGAAAGSSSNVRLRGAARAEEARLIGQLGEFWGFYVTCSLFSQTCTNGNLVNGFGHILSITIEMIVFEGKKAKYQSAKNRVAKDQILPPFLNTY
ncbi:hypothetical protein VPH35_073469 [Triticum aestivum]